MNTPIRITNAALDEFDNYSILRSVIDPASLGSLKVPTYQRLVQDRKDTRSIMKGFETRGGVPNIEVGMRGHSFTEAGGDFYLQGDCYIIDGLRRTRAAMEALKYGKHPKVGAMIHIGTTEAWETERFGIVNVNRVNISPSVRIRNQATQNAAVRMLYELNSDQSFVLEGRVSWDQHVKRGQLIKGQTLLKASCLLHRRLGPGLASPRYAEMTNGFLKVLNQVGHLTLEENVKTFWQVIDKCFNVRGLDIAGSAPYIKDGFLEVLAKFLSDHKDFWEGNKLTVATDLRRKLALFSIRDPRVAYLCGASGAGQNELYYGLETDLNKGRWRTNRLTKFVVTEFEENDAPTNSIQRPTSD
jgi:hypothetical protein